jgi:hypothetical protein
MVGVAPFNAERSQRNKITIGRKRLTEMGIQKGVFGRFKIGAVRKEIRRPKRREGVCD